MPIIRKVFMSIIRCIGCGFVGALGALILAFCACTLVDVFITDHDDSILAGQVVLLVGIYGVFVGFALGVIYGAIRTLTSLKRSTVLIAMSVISTAVLLMLILFGGI